MRIFVQALIGSIITTFGLAAFFFIPASAQTVCTQYGSNSTPPNGYGAAWNPFTSAKEVLIRVNCTDTGARLYAGRPASSSVDNPNAYFTYKTAYAYQTSWQPLTITPEEGTGSAQNGDWVSGTATHTNTLPAPSQNPIFIAAYVCYQNNGWKCGCRDSACTQNFWQLQAYKDATAGGNTGGGTGGGNTGGGTGGGNTGGSTSGGTVTPSSRFPAINECGTPQNTSSISGGNGCKTLVLSAGNYGRVNVSGHSGGVLTLRCATPGTCTASSVEISNSDGVIIDGFKVEGGNIGMEISASKNIKIRRSTFRYQTNSGLVVNPGTYSNNIQLYENNVFNDKVGCAFSGVCGTAGGNIVAEMDYGFRIYDTDNIDIQGNTFGTKFNHSISSKTSVEFMQVKGNTFNECGRTCIEPGQEPRSTGTGDRTSGEILITENTFKNVKSVSPLILVKNIRKVTFTNNILDNVQGGIKMHTFQNLNGTSGTGSLINGGVPSGRVVIQEPNTRK